MASHLSSLILILSSIALVTLHGAAPLPKEEGTARSWAEKYAERKKQWCFQPITDPTPPKTQNTAWPKNDIDRFILAKLEANGLKPAPKASADVLARRLSFALTGLPPQSDEVEVDRLLQSSAFGEHWARHWMDVVRYAETFGSEHDYLNPYAWRYRDYLVRAFNSDVPYDQFIHEQLAGDLLKTPRIRDGIHESLLGTAFQRMTEFYGAPVDVRREEASVIDWQIENVSRAFLGLTVSCARCHDHKFDPISTADFYALFGLFTGARPVMNIIDDPQRLTQHDAELIRMKKALRADLVRRWSQVKMSAASLKKAIDTAKNESLLKQLRNGAAPPAVPKKELLRDWRATGPGLPTKPLPAGTLSLHSTGGKAVRAIQPAGFYSDAISERHGGSIRSPEFILTKPVVRVLAGGTGKARLRLVVEGCQGDIVLFAPANKDLTDATPRWHTLQLRDNWLGLRAHIEVMTRDDLPTVGNVRDVQKWTSEDRRSSFGIIDYLVEGDEYPLSLPAELWAVKREPWDGFVTHFNRVAQTAIAAWQRDELTDAQARLLQTLIDAELLPNTADAALMAQIRELEARIPQATRVAGVQDDRSARDMAVYLRGDHLTPGEIVPRRMPEVLHGRALPDRLALAHELTSHDNPLTSRVMVNRVWHHLFGRGLVGSTDNFGKTGDKPTHPELLDHLATRFMRGGWSVKQLIRYIVSSNTWQMSSEPSAEAVKLDPDNLLLSHAHARRLQAEAIRDSMLAVAGNLDRTLGGPSIYQHYLTVADPDKQPPAGPVDGKGRRSIYLEVRRNFLGEFLTTFDFPRPNLPAGARSVTHVPAQSITLLNDPFVHHQAGIWAQRIAKLPEAKRIPQMYREAFLREPTQDESERAKKYLSSGASLKQLAHAMFNMKEFIFLP